MWHEARRQERKIRGMLVDYRRRAERRRDFYEKIKADPTQFLQLHGRPCKIHLDSAVATAADSPATMMPWQGQADNLIDRFDVRAHLDFIPPVIVRDSEEESYEERQCNYERYRILAQNIFLGVNEEKFLKQLHLEEQFGYTADKEKEKKGKTGVAIGFNYDEPGKENLMKSEKNSSDSDDSDSDLDVDLCIDVSKIEQSQAHEMNRCGQQLGMCSNDFYSFLINDMEEAENIRIAREEEHEKALYSGRKSRRERRAHRERRLANRIPSPPSYAARASPTYPAFRDSKSHSKSPSPENTGQITYITSFGGEDDTPSTSQPIEKVKSGGREVYRGRSRGGSPRRRRRRRDSDSSESAGDKYRRMGSPVSKKYRAGHSSSRSPSSKKFRSRHSSSDSRSKSLSPKKYRKRSLTRSPYRRKTSKSSSRSPYRDRSRSQSRSKSDSRSPYRKSSRRRRSSLNRGKYKRNYRSKSVSSSSSSSSSRSSKSRSRSRSKSVSKVRESPKRLDSPKPIQRYYGRRQEDKSSSDISDLDENNSKPMGNNLAVNEKATVFGNSGTTSKGPSVPKLTPQERLKRKMQLLLNKQYKADKIAEQIRTERAQQEQRNREDELREMALKLRRKQRERRHAYDDNSNSSNSDSSDDNSKSSKESRKRSITPPSPKRRYRDEENYKNEPKSRRDRSRSPKRQKPDDKPRNDDRYSRYRKDESPPERKRDRYDSRRDDNRKYKSLVDY